MRADPIATERLRLRPLELSDAPRIARFASDPAYTTLFARAFPESTSGPTMGKILLAQKPAATRRGHGVARIRR